MFCSAAVWDISACYDDTRTCPSYGIRLTTWQTFQFLLYDVRPSWRIIQHLLTQGLLSQHYATKKKKYEHLKPKQNLSFIFKNKIYSQSFTFSIMVGEKKSNDNM